ncbi:MAG: hypothetical protein FJX74_22085 [Armatimonadetes bacterium]|nr:hypothetical protein [Armatimonadota bacterium]
MARTMAWSRVLYGSTATAALLGLIGCGGSGDNEAGPSDAPAIVVGGFTFGAGSANLNHAYLLASATTSQRVFLGYGGQSGRQMTETFSSGGTVAGINALKVITDRPGNTQRRRDAAWIARDSLGNVHVLQRKVLNDGSGGSSPLRKLGVAAGEPAAFLLLRSADLTVGRTWFEQSQGRRVLRNRVLSTAASSQGKTNLLQVQTIEDANGDGTFSTSWSGPDVRTDRYWEASVGLHDVRIAVSPSLTGFARSTPPTTTQVNMQGFGFSPRTITVPRGSTVKWVNKESFMHTVTRDPLNPVAGGPNSDATFPSGMALNDSYSWTVPSVASGTTFFYHCRFHATPGNGSSLGAGMTGSVTVE